MKRLSVFALVLGVLLVVPQIAVAQASDAKDSGVLVRVNGDASVGASETIGTVVVVGGDVDVAGQIETLVVVDGRADLIGAKVETLVVVRGTANLTDGSVISGDAWIPNSEITQDSTSSVAGEVVDDLSGYSTAVFTFGIIFAIGLGVLAVLAALAFTAVAPGIARASITAIRKDLTQVLLSGVVLWVVVPIVASLLLVTVVGTPTALATFGLLLPILGFLGYIVASLFVGALFVADAPEKRSYKSALVGALLLTVVVSIPLVGALVGSVAALIGSSALALVGLRSFKASGDTSTTLAT